MPDKTAAPSSADAVPRATTTADALPGAPKQRACVVTLGGHAFAVDARQAREVVKLESLTAMPGAPSPLIGLTNLRGHVFAVAEARPLLGVPSRPVAAGSPALVLAAGPLQAAIPIDRVLGLDWFEAPLAPDAPADGPGGVFAAGLVPHEGHHATLLDAGRLLEALRAPWSPPATEACP